MHLTEYPECDGQYVNKELEKGMEQVLTVAVLGRAARNQANIKNRQPLSELLIVGGREISAELRGVIAEELNVKEVKYADNAEQFVSYEVKPQLNTLGPKYGKKLGKIRELMAADAAAMVAGTKNGGTYTAEIDGEKISLTETDLLIFVKNKEGFVAESDGGVTVILDTQLTSELIAEGYEREIISKVQNMRKDSGYEVTDHIALNVCGDGEINSVMEKFGTEIAAVTLADKICCEENGEIVDINGKNVYISVEKI